MFFDPTGPLNQPRNVPAPRSSRPSDALNAILGFIPNHIGMLVISSVLPYVVSVVKQDSALRRRLRSSEMGLYCAKYSIEHTETEDINNAIRAGSANPLVQQGAGQIAQLLAGAKKGIEKATYSMNFTRKTSAGIEEVSSLVPGNFILGIIGVPEHTLERIGKAELKDRLHERADEIIRDYHTWTTGRINPKLVLLLLYWNAVNRMSEIITAAYIKTNDPRLLAAWDVVLEEIRSNDTLRVGNLYREMGKLSNASDLANNASLPAFSHEERVAESTKVILSALGRADALSAAPRETPLNLKDSMVLLANYVRTPESSRLNGPLFEEATNSNDLDRAIRIGKYSNAFVVCIYAICKFLVDLVVTLTVGLVISIVNAALSLVTRFLSLFGCHRVWMITAHPFTDSDLNNQITAAQRGAEIDARTPSLPSNGLSNQPVTFAQNLDAISAFTGLQENATFVARIEHRNANPVAPNNLNPGNER